METLANELLVAIFADFTAQELLFYRRVSRTWNRRILDLFSDRFIVIIHSQHLVDSWGGTFRNLIEDKVTPTFSDFGKRICFRNFKFYEAMLSLIHNDDLIELKQIIFENLTEAFLDVHTVIFDEVTDLWFLGFFLNNVLRLDSLTLAGMLDKTDGEKGLLGLNADAFQHLRSFNVSECTFGLDDKTLLKLTSLMPNLAELNIATAGMVFFTGIIRRYYTSTDPDKLIRKPTTFNLTFAAVRAALKHHITHLTTIRLCSFQIIYDSIAHLLEYDSIKDIYIEGTMKGDAELGKKMSELKKKAKTVETNIHYTFCENPTPPE